MIAAGRLVRLSKRGERAIFSGFAGWEVSGNPFMAALRKNRRKRAHSGYRLPNQRRAYQCLNVCGVRIWADKPRQFKGMKWRARRATVARFVALCEFRDSRAWQREGLAPFAARRLYRAANDGMCMTRREALDAPDFVPAGGCWDLSPFWSPGDEPPQMVVLRGGK